MYPLCRTWRVAIVVMIMIGHAHSQHLGSSRGIALGGFTALSGGMSALDWNPAGLVEIRDWELSLTNYLPLARAGSGFVLHSATLTKRFLDDHAVALRYAPGKSLHLLIPTTFRLSDTNLIVQTEFDRGVVYEEPYAIGYAYRLNNSTSLGLTGRFGNVRVSDTRYELDTSGTIRSRSIEDEENALFVDGGFLWELPGWSFGLVVKNLFTIRETRLADDVAQYRPGLPRFVRVGASYHALPSLVVGVDLDGERRLRTGGEWNAGGIGSIQGISLRLSGYSDFVSRPVLEAIAVGIGGLYEFVEFDVSYLKFISQTNRRGRADLRAFNGASVKDIEYNSFTGDRISTTLRLYLGRVRETAVRIEGVKVRSDVHPASARIHSYTPLAEAFVQNISREAVEATVSLFVEQLMDAPTESRPVRIDPGERVSVPIYAIFNDNIRSVSQFSLREAYVYVTVQRGEGYDDRMQIHLPVHGRNDWNGDVHQLKYFVTPDDPVILQFTRKVLNKHKERIDSAQKSLRNFLRASILFDEFAKGLTYVNDPKKSQDHVQYPSETLVLRGGDCDDMTVCYASLLLSIGIPAAFIDVIPPGKPDEAHIYMMFDTGIEAQDAHVLSDNPKRFVVRRNSKGKETVWLPIETTVMTRGFDEAWSVGAKEYYDESEVGSGLIEGWLKVIDIHNVY